MRGLNIAKKYEPVYVKMRMTDHINYFDQMKKQMKKDLLHKITGTLTNQLRKSYDQLMEGFEILRLEEEEAKKEGWSPLRDLEKSFVGWGVRGGF